MITKFISSCCFFSCASLFAQATIGTEENNIIYRGLPNPVSVACGNKEPYFIKEKSTDLEVKNNNGRLYLNCLNVKEDTAFIVFGLQNSTLQRKFVFPVADVPEPVIRLGAFGDLENGISLSALKMQNSMLAVLENFVYDGVKYSVSSYQMRYFDPVYQDFKTVEAKGASLAPIKPALAKLKEGDRFELKNIQILAPGNKVISHPDILVKLN
jgi:hypothetical protein